VKNNHDSILSAALCPPRTQVIIVTGPTAVGKTAVGLELAKRLNGEVISADSVQVWERVWMRGLECEEILNRGTLGGYMR